MLETGLVAELYVYEKWLKKITKEKYLINILLDTNYHKLEENISKILILIIKKVKSVSIKLNQYKLNV